MKNLIRLLLLALCPVPAHAAGTTWIPTSPSNWATMANWNAGVPNASTDAYVATTGTAQLTALSGTAASLYVGNGSNAGYLDVRNTLTTTNTYIAYAGTGGAVSVSGAGVISATQRFYVGGPLGSGTLTVYNGGQITGGTIALGSAGTVLNLGRSGDASAPGALNVSAVNGTGTVNFLSGYAYTLAPQLSGVLSLAKSGAGPLTVTGANTYSGGSSLTSGLTLVNNTAGSGLGTGAVAVASGASLGGSGGFSGALTLNGTLTPGGAAGPGTLGTGSETWNSGGSYAFEINQATGAAGTNWDSVNADGVITLASTATNTFLIKVTSLTTSGTAGTATGFTLGQSYTWTLATSTSAITTFSADKFTLDTSAFFNDATTLGTFALGLSGDAKSLTLTYSAVPEPATAALALLGLALLAYTVHARTRRRSPDSTRRES